MSPCGHGGLRPDWRYSVGLVSAAAGHQRVECIHRERGQAFDASLENTDTDTIPVLNNIGLAHAQEGRYAKAPPPPPSST